MTGTGGGRPPARARAARVYEMIGWTQEDLEWSAPGRAGSPRVGNANPYAARRPRSNLNRSIRLPGVAGSRRIGTPDAGLWPSARLVIRCGFDDRIDVPRGARPGSRGRHTDRLLAGTRATVLDPQDLAAGQRRRRIAGMERPRRLLARGMARAAASPPPIRRPVGRLVRVVRLPRAGGFARGRATGPGGSRLGPGSRRVGRTASAPAVGARRRRAGCGRFRARPDEWVRSRGADGPAADVEGCERATARVLNPGQPQLRRGVARGDDSGDVGARDLAAPQPALRARAGLVLPRSVSRGTGRHGLPRRSARRWRGTRGTRRVQAASRPRGRRARHGAGGGAGAHVPSAACPRDVRGQALHLEDHRRRTRWSVRPLGSGRERSNSSTRRGNARPGPASRRVGGSAVHSRMLTTTTSRPSSSAACPAWSRCSAFWPAS